MPLYDFHCNACDSDIELLLVGSRDEPVCSRCGSRNLTKLMAAHSSASGPTGSRTMPGLGDTACCGSAPGQGAGCAGPGSCCGRNQ
ncbi:MAG: zinc ribbon domain-containing protein [Desulfobacterales bacterium]|nr:zinc ribbon domain-containing protein [Desulfobacterales bacterium]